MPVVSGNLRQGVRRRAVALAVVALSLAAFGGFGTLVARSSASAVTAAGSATPTQAVSGVGTVGSGLAVFPGSLHFGRVGTGSSVVQTLMLTDPGTTLHITSLTVSNLEFEVAGDDCPGTPPINSGTSCTLAVQFDPWHTGSARSTLTISTVAGSVSVLLTGTGVVGATATEPLGSLSRADMRLDELLGLAFLLLLAMAGVAMSRGLDTCAGPRSRRLPPPSSRGDTPSPGELGSPLLASDAERDAAARAVAEAIAEGRLGIEEGTARLDAVFQARHRHELTDQLADLPVTQSRLPARSMRYGPLACAAVVLAAVVVQAAAGLWELWPVAVAAVASLAARRRC